jgi:lysophospholipase L1-like esterase
MKKLFLLFSILAFASLNAQALGKTLLFDFGPNNVTDGNSTVNPDSNGAYWNNITDPASTSTISSLKENTNTTTAYGIKISGSFTAKGILTGGLTAPDATKLGAFAIATVTQDFFYTTTAGGFKLSGLVKTKAYKLYFFSSRNTSSDRFTKFACVGLNNSDVTIQSSGTNLGGTGYNGNNSTILASDYIYPDANSEINVTVSVFSGGYAYMNAMKLEEYTMPYVTTTAINVTGNDITNSGGTSQFSYSVVPTGATPNSVTWSVSDATVATIESNGLLTPKKNGTVTVSASITQNSVLLSGSKTITISNQISQLFLSGTATINGDQISTALAMNTPPDKIGLNTGIFELGTTLNTSGTFNFYSTQNSATATVYGANSTANALQVGGTAVPSTVSGTAVVRAYLGTNSYKVYPNNTFKISQMGSSVSNGQGASVAVINSLGSTSYIGYAYKYGQLLNQRYLDGKGQNWRLSNISIGGNDTKDLLARWDNDLLNDGSLYVVYALSLGNEGIISGGQVIFDQFKTNMLMLIAKARSVGKIPIVGNMYSRADYTSVEYNYVKTMDMLIHEWDVPSINLLGALDDGTGKWPLLYQHDNSHPNDDGHTEFTYAIVPSLYDALYAGKAQPVKKIGTSMSFNKTTSNKQLAFTPDNIIHSFTSSVEVKTAGMGSIGSFSQSSTNGNLVIGASGFLSYQSPNGGFINGTTVINDNQWHNVILTHYYAQGFTVLYCDGLEVGRINEKLLATIFNLYDVNAPASAEYRNWFFYRSAMNEMEVAGLISGKMLKSSLELYAPLDGQATFSSDPLVNLAQSTNVLQSIDNSKIAQTITFGAIPTKVPSDADFSAGATASSGLPVSLASSNTAVATIVNGNIDIVGAGTANITASQAGDATYNAAINVVQTLTVNGIAQTITFAALPAKVLGNVDFSAGATASSGLTVTYTSSNTAVATIVSGNIHIVGIGTAIITASQAGNATYNAATNVTQTLTVSAAPVTGGLFNEIFDYNVGALAGQGSWLEGGTVTVGTASRTIAAGALTYANSGGSFVLSGLGKAMVVSIPSGTTTSSYSHYKPFSTTPISSGVLYLSFIMKLNANTSSTNQEAFGLASGTNAGPKVLIGSTSSGFYKIGTVKASTASADYKYSTTPTSLAVGTSYLMVLKYDFATATSSVYINPTLGGTEPASPEIFDSSSTTARNSLNNFWSRATGSVVQNLTISGARVSTTWAEAVQPAIQNQTITFPALDTRNVGDANFSSGATTSSGLPVSLSSSNTAVATIVGSEIRVVGVGNTIITASQAGNTAYNPAADVSQTLFVDQANKLSQTITFAALSAKGTCQADFSAGATASSDLIVSLESSNTAVANIVNGNIHIVGAGTTTITASQAGDDTYSAAANVTQTLTVTAAAAPTASTQTLCISNSPTIASLTASGTALKWYATANGVNALATTTALATGTYYVSQTVNRCESTRTAVSVSVIACSNLKIILKLDDFSASAGISAATPVLDYLITKQVKTAIGFIADRNDATALSVFSSYLNQTNASGDKLFEVWHHGLDHVNPEFGATTYAYQKSHFDQANQLILDGLRVQMYSFGAPYNATDATTNTVISENPIYKVTMFSDPAAAASTGILNLTNRVNMETATGVPNYAAFVSNYNANKGTYTDYMVLQGHPNAYTTTAKMDEFKQIIDFLISEGVEFVLPYDYYLSLNPTYPRPSTAQTISFSVLTNKAKGDADFNPGATSTSGLTVTYNSSNLAVATIVNGSIRIVGSGTAIITASQVGNATYKPANYVSQTLTVTSREFRSLASGNWNTQGTWQQSDGNGSWTTATTIPNALNNVYIQSGHTVTVSGAEAYCYDLHTNTAGVLAISGTNSVNVNGKIRAYTGAAEISTTNGVYVGTNATTMASAMITTGSTGVLKIVGATRNITNTGEWVGASTSNNITFALDSGAIGTLQTAIKFKVITIAGGTVSTANTINVGTNEGNGIITINNGARLVSSKNYTAAGSQVITLTSVTRCGTVTIDSGGILELTGATPVIDCATFTNNGTVVYSGGAKTLLQNGSFSTTKGIPITTYGNLVISGTEAKTFPANDITVNNDFTIISGSITVPTGKNLTVNNALINNATAVAAAVVVESGANLIQGAATTVNTNTGEITIKRNSNSLYRFDYTIWSSPVSGQTLAGFSPLTSQSPNRFNTYDALTNLYVTVSPSSTFSQGTGYLIRMPNVNPADQSLTTPYYLGTPTTGLLTYNGVFTGTPNNGTIPLDNLTSDKYYSVGNPYPSTISATSFLDGNATAGVLYFWRKTNGAGGSAYASYTKALGGAAGASGIQPNGTIQVGQGFIVKTGISANSLIFTNAMRETSPSSTQFLKAKNTAQRSRLWLDLSDATGRMNQVLIGYLDSATFGFDAGIDGKYFNDSAIALTSIVDGGEYTIQGRPTFDVTDVVALGFKTDVAGTYTIALNSFDGLFAAGQDIYLVDAVAGKETDLKAESYSFTAAAGVDNTRFSLKYQKTLKVETPAFNENSVKVYENNGVFYVNSTSKTIKTIEVYDVQGRLIAQQKNVNATTATIKNVKAVRQMLIVKVSADDNSVVSKKVLNN